ncbi:MAG: polysaccharide lyase family 7 protein, partial [Bacteroidales bacterium]|nr:polysaccharide lyase family 7 protein [Bacteroidales bacterium]
FENSFSDWTDIDPSSISSVAHSGSKSAKITGSGGKVSQIISVSANTDYALSAYVNGSWRIGVYVNGQKISRSGNAADWKKETVNFNSSDATSVKIFAEYNNGTGRFDDFSIIENTNNGGGNTSIQILNIQSVTASGDDGNVPANTLDNDLNTRWSAKGSGQWIRYDLGVNHQVLQILIAWYKGDQRSASFDIFVGDSPNNLTNIFSGNSSGNTLDFETYDLPTTNARYVKIVGYGNTSNLWNSITEVKIKGIVGSSGDTTTTIVYPSDIISGLTNWKITLPVDSNGNDNSNETDVNNRNKNAWEVYDLINFDYVPYFNVINDEVVFRAHCAGATTSGSKYPRSELRQLVGGGNNYWSMNNYQYLQVELRVIHTPVEKPEVCMTQIHGPQNEPLRVQYHATKGLYLVWNESHKIYFDNDVPYTLGQKLRITVEVNNGDITCTVLNLDNNKSFCYSWTSNDNTGYFKVGCYTQSSIFLSQFKSGYNDEPIDAYGEVRVRKIDLVENYY